MAQVTLVDYTENAEEKIGRYAAICYDSDTSPEACVRRAKACCNKGHLATLRFATAVFRIEGISRSCSHQLVRSKHLDYLQESQRYVDQKNASFVMPHVDNDSTMIIDSHYKLSLQLYEALLDMGIKKEDARYLLPNGSTTSLFVVGNFQAWKDFIALRSGKEVQWEIRAIAHEVERQLHAIAPNIFPLGEQNGN